MFQRIFRFGISGGIATAVCYVVFIGLMRITNYAVAATGSWLCGVAFGFVLNRRFTFGISSSEGRGRHLALFMIGAVLQYGIAMAGYAVLIGQLKLNPTLAFLINLIGTTAFGFTFQNLVVFRRAGLPPANPITSDPR